MRMKDVSRRDFLVGGAATAGLAPARTAMTSGALRHCDQRDDQKRRAWFEHRSSPPWELKTLLVNRQAGGRAEVRESNSIET